jgi:hypothetical protein
VFRFSSETLAMQTHTCGSIQQVTEKIYQDTILQPLQELQAKDLENINPNAIELELIYNLYKNVIKF